MHREQAIALTGLKSEMREALIVRRTTEGAGAIQEWAAREADNKHLSTRLSAEMCALLSRAYTDGYYVHNARGVPSVGAFRQILTQVRSRLLAFALNLRDQVPAEATAEDIKMGLGANAVNEIFRGAVFGDNAMVIVGDNNAVRDIKNAVERNDFTSLAAALRKLDVQEDDIEQLRGAIEADDGAPEHSKECFGERVRGWVGGMAAKAGTKAWETAAAAGMTSLYAVLKAHYGWP